MLVANQKNQVKRTLRASGRLGYAAWGVVFLVVGYSFLREALSSNPGQAQDTEGAFEFLRSVGRPVAVGGRPDRLRGVHPHPRPGRAGAGG